jgi:hypothetical protein
VARRELIVEAQNRVLVDHLKAVEEASARVEWLTRSITELVEGWSLAPLVKALQALRGIRLVSAVVIAAEWATSNVSPNRGS